MKGFLLQINKEKISAESIKKGCINILLTNKEGVFKINFGGMDENMYSYTWYSSELTLGDEICISYKENVQTSNPIAKVNFAQLTKEEVLQRELETYWKLKAELNL